MGSLKNTYLRESRNSRILSMEKKLLSKERYNQIN